MAQAVESKSFKSQFLMQFSVCRGFISLTTTDVAGRRGVPQSGIAVLVQSPTLG